MIAREIQMLGAIIQFDAYLDLLQYFIFLLILSATAYDSLMIIIYLPGMHTGRMF